MIAVPGRLLARKLLDAAVYAVAVTVLLFLAGVVAGLVLGGGLVQAKFVLFVGGFLAMAYATFQLRPERPWRTERTEDGTLRVTRTDDRGDPIGADEDTRFQAALQELPPLSWYSLPPDERFPAGGKLLLASVVALATSLLMEIVFGIAA